MLQLKKVRKVYEMGRKQDENYQCVEALKGLDLSFRESEFVSILGPSGCGKTTLLNIVGGLDKYTSGDLVINGKSTKEFTDKDWDTYRNHKVGFVFQSYNLIPHLNVYENVELALTLSGIPKSERKARVIKALEDVGLGDKIYSKPNQLSGGQMQRVSIARALVNNPDIILADEPTGALDSKTSVQIMELLKQISKNKLIIMVTHNPSLAESYSTRIIKLLDGELVDDNNPFNPQEEEVADNAQEKKPKMSYLTALALSFKNLLTKKARTILVAFAGSIGIIGISLILALSSGFQTYINNVQEDTLSTYPLTIESVTVDYGSMLGVMMGNASEDNTTSEEGVVNSNAVVLEMLKGVLAGSRQNNLKEFKAWVESNEEIEEYVTAIQYSYNVNMSIYDKASSEQLSPNPLFYNGTIYFLDNLIGAQILPYFTQGGALTPEQIAEIKASEEYHNALLNAFAANMGSDGANLVSQIKAWKSSPLSNVSEMIDNAELLQSQYDVLATATGVSSDNLFSSLTKNDIVLVLDKNGNLSDYSLYSLGIKTDPSIEEIAREFAEHMKAGTEYVIPEDDGYTYDELLGKEYKIFLDTEYYKDINNNGTYVDIRSALQSKTITKQTYDNYMSDMLADPDAGIVLSIKGIVKPNANATATSISGDIGYTHALTEYMIEKINYAFGQNNPMNLPDTLKVDENNPTAMSIYCVDFESKKAIEALIADYNALVLADENKGEDYEITYSDYIGIMMSSVSTIIESITYVLIAFVSVSLIVSSIMIGIITYISVLERTKEIGVLRSIGASKKDIKNVFTAESLIIGFASGALGILVTLLLTIPINIVINSLAGLNGIAALPPLGGVILVILSMVLTFVAGMIPSRIASKKDPVIALRTE